MTNIQCVQCKRTFSSDPDRQRGSAKRYCSLKCRNAAYFERRKIEHKTSKKTIEDLEKRAARQALMIEELEEKLMKREKQSQ